jgi:hypothetical protein
MFLLVYQRWIRKWPSSESGEACLDYETLVAAYELERSLAYRLRAAFVAGWIAKERAEEKQ